MKVGSEVSSAVLLTLAITALTLGMDFLKQGMLSAGVVSVVIGFGLIAATIALVKEGIIEKIAGRR
jgi:hypothetical protein